MVRHPISHGSAQIRKQLHSNGRQTSPSCIDDADIARQSLVRQIDDFQRLLNRSASSDSWSNANTQSLRCHDDQGLHLLHFVLSIQSNVGRLGGSIHRPPD
nr:hypothetical protein [Diaphorobacter sp. HDW4B]